MTRIYKLLDAASWSAALKEGVFTGSAVDARDGFIHFSDASQAQETARLHFRNEADLVLLTIDADVLGDALRWEASRGGALFPHLYGALTLSAVVGVRVLELDTDGIPQIGDLS